MAHDEIVEIDDETLDRNWNELLQELRVTQTGVQVLAGFLLTVPFSNRFIDLDLPQRLGYLVVLTGAILANLLVIAPVAFHRVLFRQRKRRWIVEAANRCARGGLVLIGLTLCGASALVFDVVAGRVAASIVLGVLLVLFVGLWLVVPGVQLRRGRATDSA